MSGELQYKGQGDDPVQLALALRGGAVVHSPFVMSRDQASHWIRDWYDGLDEACKVAKELWEGGPQFAVTNPVACGPVALNTAGEPNWALMAWDRSQVIAMWVVPVFVPAAPPAPMTHGDIEEMARKIVRGMN